MKKSVSELTKMKGKEKISVLTCYDYSFAKLLNGKVDIILVGDSLGNVVLGYDRTKHVLLSDMIRHLEAVRRGAPDTFIVCDLPFGSYDTEKDAVSHAKQLIDSGADAVKPEGKPEIVKALTSSDIPVMGHVGLLPQSAEKFVVAGKGENAQEVVSLAKAIEEAGAFSVVIETVPLSLSLQLTAELTIPTIGIGAGPECDGQVLVLYDLLGLFSDFKPKFVRSYAELSKDISFAVSSYSADVKKGDFPDPTESFK